jgi:hypothetical protein
MIELDKLAPASMSTGSTTTPGLQPALRLAVDRLIAASNGRVYVESGIRSTARQTELWNEALAKYGDPEIADNWVARPGTSNHESGLAVDLGGDLGLAVRLVDDLGLPLWRPMSWEPWHFELAGSRWVRGNRRTKEHRISRFTNDEQDSGWLRFRRTDLPHRSRTS